jgi:SAM-dependent methyltransferase
LHAYDEVLLRLAERLPKQLLHDPAMSQTSSAKSPCEARDQPILLEIGCAYGHFLNRAREWGWSPRGIEVASEPSTFARQHWNIAVETGTVSDSTLPDSSVIEHVRDPVRLLEEVLRIAKPGSLVYLTTPNIQSLSARLQGQQWEFKSFPNHLWYFSAHTLMKAFERSGYEVEEISSHPGESTVGLDESLARRQLCLESDEISSHELVSWMGKHLLCSELWVLARAK